MKYLPSLFSLFSIISLKKVAGFVYMFVLHRFRYHIDLIKIPISVLIMYFFYLIRLTRPMFVISMSF